MSEKTKIKVTERRAVDGKAGSEITVEFQVDTVEGLLAAMERTKPVLDAWQTERLEQDKLVRLRNGVETILLRARAEEMDRDARAAFAELITLLPPDEQVDAQARLSDSIRIHESRVQAEDTERRLRFGRSGGRVEL